MATDTASLRSSASIACSGRSGRTSRPHWGASPASSSAACCAPPASSSAVFCAPLPDRVAWTTSAWFIPVPQRGSRVYLLLDVGGDLAFLLGEKVLLHVRALVGREPLQLQARCVDVLACQIEQRIHLVFFQLFCPFPSTRHCRFPGEKIPHPKGA